MKSMQKLTAGLLVGLVFLSSPFASLADKSFVNEELELSRVEEKFLRDAGQVMAELIFNGGNAICNVRVQGKSETTKIVADIILEKKVSGSFTRLVTWQGVTSYSNILSTTKTYGASKGSYRLTVVAKIYSGNTYETKTISDYADY